MSFLESPLSQRHVSAAQGLRQLYKMIYLNCYYIGIILAVRVVHQEIYYLTF
jgi:hypothetical protein